MQQKIIQELGTLKLQVIQYEVALSEKEVELTELRELKQLVDNNEALKELVEEVRNGNN